MDFATTARLLTPRGWGLVLAGAAALLIAQVMGRRDVLVLALFLLALPLLSAVALRLVKPVFDVERSFSSPAAETGVPVTVVLSLRTPRPVRESATMREGLPLRFGDSPLFRFPASFPGPDGTSSYEYQLRSTRRGLFPIGPVTAEFSDLFGLSRRRQILGAVDSLVVSPAPQALPRTLLGGPRGTEGSVSNPRRGSPSEDDVSTREYRAGDPMRRVHWAATARHGELMVRQEEPVTSPGATLLLDAREGCHAGGAGSSLWLEPADGNGLSTSETFEWAVTAAVSVAGHLVENGYSLHVLDPQARPGLARSPSAPDPRQRNFSGPAGLQDLGEGLAALGLESRPSERTRAADDADRRRDSDHPRGSGISGKGSGAGISGMIPGRRNRGAGPDHAAGDGSRVFGDALLDSLAQRRRGPLVAVLGRLSVEDAHRLAPASGYASRACAILVMDRPQEAGPALTVLRTGGWDAVAVSPASDLARVWASFEAPAVLSAPVPIASEDRT